MGSGSTPAGEAALLDPKRWQSLMTRLGIAEHGGTYDALRTAYAEPHRAYHNADHIAACLRHLDGAVGLIARPDEVEIALWIHDAVYATRASDNERKSAEWAVEFLRSAGAAREVCDRVAGHIVATEHSAAPGDPDSALVVDIDLTILGSPPDAYRTFETDIRREYKWVPGPLFRRKRREVLENFLARPFVYTTDRFRDRYEAAARRNLKAAIAALD